MEDQDKKNAPLNAEDDGIQKSDVNNVLTSHVEPLSEGQYLLNNFLEGLKKTGLRILDFIISIFLSIYNFFAMVFKGIYKGCVGIYQFFENKVRQFKYNDWSGKLSFVIFGASSFKHKQYANGVLFILFEIVYIVFMAMFGFHSIYMLGTLGTVMPGPDPNCDDMFCEWVKGDNSVLLLIYGLLSLLSIVLFVYVRIRSINAGYNNYRIDNYMSYKKLFENNVEFSNNVDASVKEAISKGISKKDFKKEHKSELDAFIASIEINSDEKSRKFEVNNAKFIYRKSIAYSYAEHTLINKNTAKLNKLNEKLQEIKSKLDEEKSSIRFENEKALQIFETKAKGKINKQVSKINKEKNKLREILSKHSSFCAKELVINSSKYGRFNEFYKVQSKYQNEIRFFENYGVIVNKYESLKGKYQEVNVNNAKQKEELTNSLNEKIQSIEKKYDDILNKKKDLISKLKNVNDKKAQELKHVKDVNLIREIEDKYFPEISSLSSQIHALPEDKNVKAMRKEEIKEIKHATKRDVKYLKTNFTEYSYSKEEIVNFLLLEYKFEYDFASKIVNNLFIKEKDKTIRHLTEEEVEDKLEKIRKELNDYQIAHPDNFVGRPKSFKEQINSLKNENFHLTILSLPVLGIILFTIIPLFFSILVAFTNYSFGHVPPTQLFTWIGFENFFTLFNAPADSIYSKLPSAIGSTLGWTIIWTFIATFSNYFLGIIVALLINKKGIRLKKFWRTIFVLTIAIPQFISLMTVGVLLKDTGAIGQWWFMTFGSRLGFGTDATNGALVSKIIILLVNIWIGIPYTILSTTGILMNIPNDLYESATVDGAGPTTQFTKITLPYILFVTGPYLITQFIGNINNFNVIYFLTGGGPNLSGTALQVGHTDLLVTFLFKMITSTNNPQYGIASTIGILIFVICAFFSIIMYNKTGAVQSEDQFQ